MTVWGCPSRTSSVVAAGRGGGRGAKLDSILILPIRQLRSWKWLLSTISFCCLTMANGDPWQANATHPSMTMANFDPWQDFHPLSLDPLGPGQRTAQHAFNATHAQSQQFDAHYFCRKTILADLRAHRASILFDPGSGNFSHPPLHWDNMAHNDDTEQPQVNTQVVIATLGLLLMTSTATVYRTGIHRRKRRRRKHPNKPRLRPHRRTLGKYLLAARRCGKARHKQPRSIRQRIKNNTATNNHSWVGGAGGSATTRRRQQQQQPSTSTNDCTLLESVEAITRTIRLGMIPEAGLATSLLRVLELHGHKDTTGNKAATASTHHTIQQWPVEQLPAGNPGGATHPWGQPKQQAQWTTTTASKQHWQSNSTDNQWPTVAQTHRQVTLQPGHKATAKQVQAFITSEWLLAPKLTTAKAVLTAIQDGGTLPGNLVQVNEAEAVDLSDCYQAFEPKESITMFWHGSASNTTETSRRVRAQYKGSSQFQPVQLTFQCLGTNGPLPKPPQKVTIHTGNTTDERCTIRITAPEIYRRAFLNNKKEDDPKQILYDLQRWNLSNATRGQLTNGEWKRNCTTQGTQLQGHIKVRKALADELLAHSGNRALFITQCGNRQQQLKVKWHKKLKDESHENYFRRVEQTAQAESKPIRFRTGGAADLGTDTTEDISRNLHWELQGSPHQWDDQDLSTFLSSNNWQIHRIHLRRKGFRNTYKWTFQGIAPGNSTDSHMYEDGDNAIFIHPVAAPRRHQVYAEALHGPRQRWGQCTASGQPTDDDDIKQPSKKHCQAPRNNGAPQAEQTDSKKVRKTIPGNLQTIHKPISSRAKKGTSRVPARNQLWNRMLSTRCIWNMLLLVDGSKKTWEETAIVFSGLGSRPKTIILAKNNLMQTSTKQLYN